MSTPSNKYDDFTSLSKIQTNHPNIETDVNIGDLLFGGVPVDLSGLIDKINDDIDEISLESDNVNMSEDIYGDRTINSGGYAGDVMTLFRDHINEAVQKGELTNKEAGEAFMKAMELSIRSASEIATSENELKLKNLSSKADLYKTIASLAEMQSKQQNMSYDALLKHNEHYILRPLQREDMKESIELKHIDHQLAVEKIKTEIFQHSQMMPSEKLLTDAKTKITHTEDATKLFYNSCIQPQECRLAEYKADTESVMKVQNENKTIQIISQTDLINSQTETEDYRHDYTMPSEKLLTDAKTKITHTEDATKLFYNSCIQPQECRLTEYKADSESVIKDQNLKKTIQIVSQTGLINSQTETEDYKHDYTMPSEKLLTDSKTNLNISEKSIKDFYNSCIQPQECRLSEYKADSESVIKDQNLKKTIQIVSQTGLIDSQTKTEDYKHDYTMPSEKLLTDSKTALNISEKSIKDFYRSCIQPQECRLAEYKADSESVIKDQNLKKTIQIVSQTGLIDSQTETEDYRHDYTMPSEKLLTDSKTDLNISEKSIKDFYRSCIQPQECRLSEYKADSESVIKDQNLKKTIQITSQTKLIDSQKITEDYRHDYTMPSEKLLTDSKTALNISEKKIKDFYNSCIQPQECRLTEYKADSESVIKDQNLKKTIQITSQTQLIESQTETEDYRHDYTMPSEKFLTDSKTALNVSEKAIKDFYRSCIQPQECRLTEYKADSESVIKDQNLKKTIQITSQTGLINSQIETEDYRHDYTMPSEKLLTDSKTALNSSEKSIKDFYRSCIQPQECRLTEYKADSESVMKIQNEKRTIHIVAQTDLIDSQTITENYNHDHVMPADVLLTTAKTGLTNIDSLTKKYYYENIQVFDRDLAKYKSETESVLKEQNEKRTLQIIEDTESLKQKWLMEQYKRENMMPIEKLLLASKVELSDADVEVKQFYRSCIQPAECDLVKAKVLLEEAKAENEEEKVDLTNAQIRLMNAQACGEQYKCDYLLPLEKNVMISKVDLSNAEASIKQFYRSCIQPQECRFTEYKANAEQLTYSINGKRIEQIDSQIKLYNRQEEHYDTLARQEALKAALNYHAMIYPDLDNPVLYALDPQAPYNYLTSV